MKQQTLEQDHYDIVAQAEAQLEFLARMILAWNTDDIEIGDAEKDGFYFSLECVRKELTRIIS